MTSHEWALPGPVEYLHWIPLSLMVGVMAGSASGGLIVFLAWATVTREYHRWIIALLPLSGLLVGRSSGRHRARQGGTD